MANILVTGGDGFIGQNLVSELYDQGHNVVVVARRPFCRHEHRAHVKYCDLTDTNSARYLFYNGESSEPCIDTIFHLAGNAIVRENSDDPTNISQTNIIGTHNLLAHAPQGCKFIFASSATIYGDAYGDFAHENAIPTPTSIYGATKVAGEALVNAYTSLGNVHGINLRLIANVGRHSTHGLLHDVIRKLRSDSVELELLGDHPGSYKPYIHVCDTVRGMIKAMEWDNGTYNIATMVPLSVERVAQIAMEELGITKYIKWLGAAANWKGDNRVVCINTSKSRKNGFRPDLESEQAVRQAIHDIINQKV